MTYRLFIVTLRVPEPDSIHKLRAALKMLWRRLDMRCVSIVERRLE